MQVLSPTTYIESAIVEKKMIVFVVVLLSCLLGVNTHGYR